MKCSHVPPADYPPPPDPPAQSQGRQEKIQAWLVASAELCAELLERKELSKAERKFLDAFDEVCNITIDAMLRR